MNPWDIIGWVILALLTIVIALVVVVYFGATIQIWWRYLRTRNIAPTEGQRWYQEGYILTIGKRWPAGHFTIHCGSASWGETDDSWRDRVRNRKMFLVRGA